MRAVSGAHVKGIKNRLVESLNSEVWEVVPFKEICPLDRYSMRGEEEGNALCLHHPTWPIAVTQEGVVYLEGARLKIRFSGCLVKAVRRQIVTRLHVVLTEKR